MLFDNMFSKLRKPKFCGVIITDNCLMRCRMCSLWKTEHLPDNVLPSVEDWKKFFISLKNYVVDPIEINFSGGEPLIVFDKVIELIKFCNKLGFITSLNSNGYLFDAAAASQIKQSGLSRIMFSLDSLNAGKHDHYRGRSGSFDKVMTAMENLSVEGIDLDIGVQTIIMNDNLDDIIPLVHWTQQNDKLKFIHFQAIIEPIGETHSDENWYKNDTYSQLWPKDLEKAYHVLDQLMLLRDINIKNPYKIANSSSQFASYKSYFKSPNEFIRKKRICNTVDFAINVNKLGQVYLCMFMEPIGTIKDPVRDMWFSKKAENSRNRIKQCKNNCNFLVNCNYED